MRMLIPGETISHQFTIPFLVSEIHSVYVSYKQKDDIILERNVPSRNIEQIEDDKSQVTVVLSQDESLLFKDDCAYTIQLNVITTFGSRIASNEIRSRTGTQHIKEVISSG